MGPYARLEPFELSIEGTLVAYTGRDYAHERDLWLGDLRNASIPIVYEARQPYPNHRVDIWSIALGAGSVYWLEFTHIEDDAASKVLSWVVKRMDVQTRSITMIAQGEPVGVGGKKYVERIRWDGTRLGALVSTGTTDNDWKIELWSPDGTVQYSVDVPGSAYDFALVNDGVIFTAGVPYPKNDAVGKTKLFRWTAAEGTKQIGSNAFHLAGCGDLAAWVIDNESSNSGTGYPVRPQLFVSRAPFEQAESMSPRGGHPLVYLVTCDVGAVLWWESELGPSGRDVPTVWKPEWKAPLQIETDYGAGGTFAAGGGWIAWFEWNANVDAGRLRAIPVSVLSEANAVDPPPQPSPK